MCGYSFKDESKSIESTCSFGNILNIKNNYIFTILPVKVLFDVSNNTLVVPALLINGQPLRPALDFVLFHQNIRSNSWLYCQMQALRLFLEYSSAHSELSNKIELFLRFTHTLSIGTYNTITGIDHSNLCWQPKSLLVKKRIINSLDYFFGWLSENFNLISQVDIKHVDSKLERRLYFHSLLYRRNKAFLGYTWSINNNDEIPKQYRYTRLLPKVSSSRPPSFPEDHFLNLLIKVSCQEKDQILEMH